MAAESQARVATQCRLDACAVRLATVREQLLSLLTRANPTIQLTAAAVTAARAGMAVPGAGPAAAMGQAALLHLNHALAAAQEGAVAAFLARETVRARCEADRFSRAPTLCFVRPAASAAFERLPTPFPDIAGPLRHRSTAGDLARILCRSGNLVTELAVRGDASLRRPGFTDAYLH